MLKPINKTLKILTLLVIAVSLCSCSTVPRADKGPERDLASKNCWDSVRPEYNSYFDSVEKCIEKKDKK